MITPFRSWRTLQSW